MPSSTRTVTISLVEQSLAKRTCYFTPRLSSADGDVVLNKVYKKTTDASGDATIALPTKASGTITYDYRLPTSVPGEYSEGTFHLSAGSAIDLEDLIAAGGVASDTVIDYVDERTADSVALNALLDLDTPGLDGQKLMFRDEVIINVLETYRRLDTEFGVVADDSTNNTTAIQTALTAVRDSNGGTLVFPNGITRMSGAAAATSVDLNGKAGTVRLLGDGGNSVLKILSTSANSIFLMQNVPQVIAEGITFLGSPGNSVFDFNKSLFWFNACQQAVIRDCRFIALSISATEDATHALNKWNGIIVSRQTELVIEKTLFGGCATRYCPNVSIDDGSSAVIRDTQFIDYGLQGATNYAKIGDFPNTYWIRATNMDARTLYADNRGSIVIDNVAFDEAVGSAVHIEGARSVDINHMSSNIGNSDLSPNVYLKGVRHAMIRNSRITTANYAGTYGIEANNCKLVEVQKVDFAGNVRYIILSGTTQKLRLNDSLRAADAAITVTNTAGATIEGYTVA